MQQKLEASKDPNQEKQLTKEIQIATAELQDIVGKMDALGQTLSKKDEMILVQKIRDQAEKWEKEDDKKRTDLMQKRQDQADKREKEDNKRRVDSYRPKDISDANWEKMKSELLGFGYNLKNPDDQFSEAVEKSDVAALKLFFSLENVKFDTGEILKSIIRKADHACRDYPDKPEESDEKESCLKMTKTIESFFSNGARPDNLSKFPFRSSSVARILLDHGFDPNASASSYEHTMDDVAPLLVKALVSYDENLKLAELLIAKGADVNVKDKDGLSLLWKVATPGNSGFRKQSAEAVKLLLVSGADVNYKNKEGKTDLEALEERTMPSQKEKPPYEEIKQMLKDAIARKQG